MLYPYRGQFCRERLCAICEVYHRRHNESNHQALSLKAESAGSIPKMLFGLAAFFSPIPKSAKLFHIRGGLFLFTTMPPHPHTYEFLEMEK